MTLAVRKKYHSSIKIACKLNILPHDTLKLLPKSSIHRFKNTDFSEYFGYDIAVKLEDSQSIIKELFNCKCALVTAKAIIKVKNTIIHINEFKIKEFQKMKCIISTINQVKDSISLDYALTLFNISKSTFYSWSFQINHICFESFIGKCIKRFPNQISLNSINKIKSLCEDKIFKGWPIVSIYYYAKRNNILNISIHSWYKYTKLLGISERVSKCLKKRKTGVRASYTHQFWHADVTVFKTLDNVKAYIYLVVDNFSRAILSWDVSIHLSASIRLDSIKDAYNKFILNTNNINNDVHLIVDGGSENNNYIVDEYISTVSIKKLIAQKDIIFSNSLVESVNKIIKYRSLFLHNIPDINALKKHLDEFIPVYNDIRPHVSLNGLTPNEVLTGFDPNNSEHLKSVNIRYNDRISHRNNPISCSVCS
jgi:putative transposase